MARTTVPLMLKAVEDKNYKIGYSTEENLEGKVILSISFGIGEQEFLLSRSIKDKSPLMFNSSSHLKILENNNIIFEEDIRYYGGDSSAKIIFKEVERREPEYLRTW